MTNSEPSDFRALENWDKSVLVWRGAARPSLLSVTDPPAFQKILDEWRQRKLASQCHCPYCSTSL